MINVSPQASALLAELDSLLGFPPGPATLKELGIEVASAYGLGRSRRAQACAEFARAARRAADIADALAAL